jgi:hypothetical protein
MNQQVNAFCLWDCDAQKVRDVGSEFLDCLRFQISMGDYGTSLYSDITEDNKVKSRAEPGKMISEDELKQEWKDHSGLYERDCHKTWDLTPQLLDRSGPPDE